MKILEPVDQSNVPAPQIGSGAQSKYHEVYERVLSLNGQALPIEFEDSVAALKQTQVWRQRASACYKRGIHVAQRGNIVYLTKAAK